jgi:predicted dithiol-disulfide oxidoreductase (DUF899 family)
MRASQASVRNHGLTCVRPEHEGLRPPHPPRRAHARPRCRACAAGAPSRRGRKSPAVAHSRFTMSNSACAPAARFADAPRERGWRLIAQSLFVVNNNVSICSQLHIACGYLRFLFRELTQAMESAARAAPPLIARTSVFIDHHGLRLTCSISATRDAKAGSAHIETSRCLQPVTIGVRIGHGFCCKERQRWGC